MEKIIAVVKIIAEVIGYITAIFVFLVGTIKPLRTKVGDLIRKISKTDELSEKIDGLIEIMSEYVSKNEETQKTLLDSIAVLKSGSAVLLGNAIKDIYNQYKDEKRIPEKEFEIVEKMYSVYHDGLSGNGVIERIHEEMKEWEILIG